MAPIPLSHSKTDPRAVLSDLVQVNYDAIEAYAAAVGRLHDEDAKGMLLEFLGDHRRHTEQLGDVLRELGDEPPHGPGAKRLLIRGRVVLSEALGDKAILRAMRSNAESLNRAYEEALSRGELNDRALAVLRGDLQDERRHRARIEAKLESM